ncbi:hypothetical protein [Paenibacillus tepidiphilus]|uniref:hypothetical protein n=1 Tax=Paenibacillus tepidiphilus TaxID=2608683 RepID=UPI0012392804|nr:hypothetical protein [Paenibacillus tepidiphilus]
MTLRHYLGSDRPFQAGHFGYVYTYKRYGDIPKSADPQALHNIIDLSHLDNTLVQEFESELDAVGLEITDISSLPWRQRLAVSKPYVYDLFGAFELRPELQEQAPQAYAAGLKCLGLLFSQIDEHLSEGETVELYSCWDGEEEMGVRSEWTLHLPSFTLGGPFALADKQLIRVTK